MVASHKTKIQSAILRQANTIWKHSRDETFNVKFLSELLVEFFSERRLPYQNDYTKQIKVLCRHRRVYSRLATMSDL